ncbi:MAG: acyl carrier protein [Nitrosopumilaceae archaeon]
MIKNTIDNKIYVADGNSHCMESVTVENQLKGIFNSVFPNVTESTFSWEKDQTQYENWDSFTHLRLVTEIENKFNIKLEIDEVLNVRSASDFLKIIKAKTTA